MKVNSIPRIAGQGEQCFLIVINIVKRNVTGSQGIVQCLMINCLLISLILV